MSLRYQIRDFFFRYLFPAYTYWIGEHLMAALQVPV
jgi:hypothetical protein